MIPNSLPKSIIDNPRLDQWVRFEDNVVYASTGKVELGQGVLTALAQIAAEELDVEINQVRLISGETTTSPNEGYTAGSASIEVGGSALRLVAAEIRSRFVRFVADRFGLDPDEITITNGAFFADGRPLGISYWSERDSVDLTANATGTAKAKDQASYRLVGSCTQRIDLPGKVTGQPVFLHDITLENMVHARALRRPWRGARLSSSEIKLPKRFSEAVALKRHGDFLALLSDDESAVAECAKLVAPELKWENGTPIPDEANTQQWLKGLPTSDPGAAGRAEMKPHSGGVITAEYWRSYIAHGSIGPSCAIAQEKNGQLSVFTHSQGVFALKNALAQALKRDAVSIDVFHRQGAGCYGHNGADDAAFDAAFLATLTDGRPVRVLWNREDELSASPVGAAMSIEIRAELNDRKRPSNWTINVWSTPHGQRPGMSGGANLLGAEAIPDGTPPVVPIDVPDAMGAGAMRNALALYDFPQETVSHFIPTLPVRTSSLRGLGALGNVFAIESFIDELAEAANEDPVAYRLSLLSGARARQVIMRAAAISGWETRARESETSLGFAFSQYKNHAAYMAAIAEVSVGEVVRVHKVWCAVDAGLVINPDGARNQIEGGIVQATSWALHEEVQFANGRSTALSWSDYPILKFSETPEVEIEMIEAHDKPSLGVGEVALGPTVAAIGNAVSRALGVRVRRLPFSRERLVEALA